MHRRHQGPHRQRRPILEIDHIQDLALGGDDDPVQMIAFCPNHHARKTRGAKRYALKPILLATAKARHERLAWSAAEVAAHSR